MLKVAVCLAGQTRFIEEALPSLRENLLSLYDCDVFLHSWDYDDRIGKPYVPGQPAKGIIQPNYRQLVQDSYRPKRCVFEAPLYKPSKSASVEDFIRMQLYSRKRVVEIASDYAQENEINYYSYVVTRTDLLLGDRYEIANVDQNKLACVEWTQWFDQQKRRMINDLIYSGNQQVITQATTGTYYELLKKGVWRTLYKFWCCEELLGIATSGIERHNLSNRFGPYRAV